MKGRWQARIRSQLRQLLVGLLLMIPCVVQTGCEMYSSWISEQIQHMPDDWSDSEFVRDRTKLYERKGQDPDTARRNAEYDLLWEKGNADK